MRHPFASSLLVLLFACGVGAAPPPDPDDPLIAHVTTAEGRTGEHVVLFGYNFGNAPQAEFNGIPASTVVYDPTIGRLAVAVPVGATVASRRRLARSGIVVRFSTSGPLIVRNTDNAMTSNPAAFTVLPGSYTSVCTISGTVTDPDAFPVPNVPVVAVETGSGDVERVAVTNVAGHYTLDLPATGTYAIGFFPPGGTSYLEHWTEGSCTGTLHHGFAAGLRLSGTVRAAEIPNDPQKNSRVLVGDGFGQFFETITDTNGEFSIAVVAGTYDVYVRGPIGTRFRSRRLAGVEVLADTDLGDVSLSTGWLLSGTVRYRDSSGAAPLMDETLLLREQGIVRGSAESIVDGRFWLPTASCTDCTLHVVSSRWDLLELQAKEIDVAADHELGPPLTVYSSEPHVSTLPGIVEASSTVLQEAQPVYLFGMNLGGSSVSVHFEDGVGGTVTGADTRVDPDRGVIMTRVPNGAVSGSCHVRVDGVDSEAQPTTINPGLFDPGSYTISGTVTDGSNPLEGILIVQLHVDECDEDHLVGYDVTDAAGGYSLHHATGNHLVYLLPPSGSDLASQFVFLEGLTGSTTANVILIHGQEVTGRVVDSGIGPVGATGVPVAGGQVRVEGHDVWAEDWVRADSGGSFAMDVVPGAYELDLEAPSESRYLERELDIDAPGDLGDFAVDSGYFVEGYLVDEAGRGVAGIEVEAREVVARYRAGSTTTLGEDGRFRMAVPAGTYEIRFWIHPDLDYYIEPVPEVEVVTDTLLLPASEAVTAARITGTVYLPDGTTPAPEMWVHASDPETSDNFLITDSCLDGTYDLRVPPGGYLVQAWSGLDDPCMAREYYPGTHYICDAETVSVALPDPTTGIDLVLDPAGSVSGRVVDDWGFGIPDATVCVDGGPGASTCQIRCASTDGEGRYVLDNVPSGVTTRMTMTHPSMPTECWDGHFDCTGYDDVPVGFCALTSGIHFGPTASVPGPVPDGAQVPGVPLTVSRGPGMLTVHWQPTCDAVDHALYVGDIGDFENYTWASCSIGTSGEHSLAEPSGSVFFLVVGTNRPNEGSYGRASDGSERPAADGQHCGAVQDLWYECVP